MPQDSNAPDDGRTAKRSFAITENDIARDPTLPADVKTVYRALAGYADTDRVAWPGQDRIAYESSLSIRTVGKAIRQGAECGLWTVVPTQTSNRYRLHDADVDPQRYVVGSGPRTPPPFPVGMSRRLDRQEAPTGSARGADEQDQLSPPVIRTNAACEADSPPSEARSISGRPTNLERPRMTLHAKPEYWDPDTKPAAHLVAYADAAARADGYALSEPTKRWIGREVKEQADADRQGLLAEVQRWLNENAQIGADLHPVPAAAEAS